MNRFWVRQLGFIVVVLVIAAFFWSRWIPNLPIFEAPGWDQADRSHDAFVVFRGLAHFDLRPLLSQLLFFETWGPLFATFAQAPLAIFGANAHSLTFVSFAGFFFACAGASLFIARRLGALAALATFAFGFLWIASVPGFGAYFVAAMLESWVIVGWTWIAIGGAIEDVDLLVIGSWILYLAKYQYYPIFFFAFVLLLAWQARRKLAAFVREIFQPLWTKFCAGLIAIAGLHVLIMKAFGPIYGDPGWTQPDALRNPVLYAFILLNIVAFARRKTIYALFPANSWALNYTKWFFWPASVLLAFPWPNRWAGVMVTQAAEAKSHTFFEICSIYGHAVASALKAPSVTLTLLIALVLIYAWAAYSKLSRAKFENVSMRAFASAIFIVQVAILMFAVKNVQARFAFCVFLSVPVGVFAFVLAAFPERPRRIVASVVASLIALFFILTPYFQPTDFFLATIGEHTNPTFTETPQLYPLDNSLGPLVKDAAKTVSGRPVRFAILQTADGFLWDRAMKIWPIAFELETGIASEPTTPMTCAQAKADPPPDLILQATTAGWTRACP